jgi:hypothetical protein
MYELLFIIFIVIVVGEVASLNWDSLTIQDEMEDWHQQKVRLGYIKEDGQPIKCFCGCIDLRYRVTDRIDNIVCEQEVHCIRCSKLVGHWAYGNWQIL